MSNESNQGYTGDKNTETHREGKMCPMGTYFDKRVKKQLLWYEKKANTNKRTFMSYQTIIIFLGAIIPVLVAFEGSVKR